MSGLPSQPRAHDAHDVDLRVPWFGPGRWIVGATPLALLVPAALLWVEEAGDLPTFVLAVGLALLSAYLLSAMLTNETHIRVRAGSLEVRHGPVPLLPAHQHPLDGEAQLRVVADGYTQGPSTLAGRCGYTHGIELVAPDGTRNTVISGLTRRECDRIVARLQ